MKQRKPLSKGAFIYWFVSLGIVTGMLVASVIYAPEPLDMGAHLDRVGYAMICIVTVWVGWTWWAGIRDYIDVAYAEYVRREKEKARGPGEVVGTDRV